MKIFRTLILSFLLLPLVLAAAEVRAQDEAPSLRVVRVGYTQFTPFSETLPNGVAHGYSIDLYRLLLEPQGYTIQFVEHQNPAELLDSLRAGRIDATTLLAISAQRSEVGNFSDVFREISVGFITRAGAPVINEAEDLAGLRVGVSHGALPERVMREMGVAHVVSFENGNDLLMPLLDGSVDAIAAIPESILYQAEQVGVRDRIVRSPLTVSDKPVALLVDPGNDALLADINEALQLDFGAGELDRLEERWFGDPVREVSAREVTAYVVASAALALLGGHLLIAHRHRRASKREALFQQLLDVSGTACLMMDKDTRPLWWNDAFEHAFPNQVPLIERGATLMERIISAHLNGTSDTQLTDEDAARRARNKIAILKAKGEISSYNTTPDGRRLKRRVFRLGSGKFGILASDVTQLHETSQRLQAANLELEATKSELETAVQRLSDFNTIAAHDLKAPLRNIGQLQAWIADDRREKGIVPSEQEAQSFEMIDQMTKRLMTMVDDLLSYTTFNSGITRLDFDPTVRLQAILDVAVTKDGFLVSLPNEVPRLTADPQAFDVVLRNLISNAIKHHDKDQGSVNVSARVDGGFCVFDVIDDGPGIPEMCHEVIFEPMRSAKSRDQGAGTGLGLSFVKRSVEAWGGRVTVVNNPSGRGCRFTFSVPLARSMVEEIGLRVVQS